MNSERIYQDEDNQWFYSRRGEHAGPYASEQEARRELKLYVRGRNRRLNYDLVGSSVSVLKSMLRKFAA